jgi:hypothetical protein
MICRLVRAKLIEWAINRHGLIGDCLNRANGSEKETSRIITIRPPPKANRIQFGVPILMRAASSLAFRID